MMRFKGDSALNPIIVQFAAEKRQYVLDEFISVGKGW